MNIEVDSISHEPKSEQRVYTPEDFVRDNHSLLADQNRNTFSSLRNNGELFLITRCSDARGNIPELNCIDISNIATDGPQQPYQNLIIGAGVKAIMEMTHFDGEKFRLGQHPTGCGGLEAKQLQLLEAPSEKDMKKFGLPRYVEAIKSPDPVVLAYYNAQSIASHTTKPVMAAIQDHVSGIIYPLATFQNDDGEIISRTKLPTRYMFQDQYDQRVIYKEGIPILSYNNLPEVFKEFLDLNQKQISDLELKYSNLHEILRVQNPHFVIVTTEKMNARARFPEILKEPGSYFQVHIPRDKQEQIISIDPKTIETALEQIQYPIEHFSKVDTILIETSDLAQSKKIGSALIRATWMQNWQKKRQNHQIFTAESRVGKIVRLEEFK